MDTWQILAVFGFLMSGHGVALKKDVIHTQIVCLGPADNSSNAIRIDEFLLSQGKCNGKAL